VDGRPPPGRVARALAVGHELALAALVSSSVALGAFAWVPLVRALPLATSVGSTPSGGLHHGIAWTWPVAVAALLLGAAWGRRRTRAFVAMVLAPRNVLPGLLVGVASFGVARVLLASATLALLPGRDVAVPWPSALLTVLGWTVAALVAGRAVQAGVTGRPPPSLAAAAWAVTWRAVGMLVPIGVAALGFGALLLFVATIPGFALIPALREFPGMPVGSTTAGVLFKSVSIPWVVLGAAWAAALATALGSFVPGHVFWRVVEAESGAPSGGAGSAPER
jgi:hypothetical protein